MSLSMSQFQHRVALFLIASLLLGVLAACGGAAESPAPTPIPTADVAADVENPVATDVPASTEAEPPVSTGMTRFVVVTEESQAAYIVQEELFSGALEKFGLAVGNSVVKGVTPQVSGSLDLDLSDPQSALVGGQFSVDITLLQTDQNMRDGWIQDNGPRLGSFPVATFVPTAIEGAPASYTEGEEVTFQLLGDLTVREITQPVTFDVTATLADGTIQATALADMNLSDFGIDPPSFAGTLTVADPLQIEVILVARAE